MRSFASLAVLLVLATGSVYAQEQTDLAAGMWQNLRQIPAGTTVAVELKDGSSARGQLIEVSDTVMGVDAKGKRRVISRDQVQRVWRVRRKPAALYAGIGLGVGLGAFLGLHAALLPKEPWPTHPADARLMPLSAGLGALVGYAIGRRERRDLIYDAALLGELPRARRAGEAQLPLGGSGSRALSEPVHADYIDVSGNPGHTQSETLPEARPDQVPANDDSVAKSLAPPEG